MILNSFNLHRVRNFHIRNKTMTLHLNMSENVSQKVLAFLESLTKKGEHVEIVDDSLYQYEKKGILKGLQQLETDEIYSSDELLDELNNES